MDRANLLMLDTGGLLASAIVGLIVYAFMGVPALVMLIVFLLVSVWASKEGEEEKKKLGVFEYSRGWKNVLSNGLVPSLAAIISPSFGPLPFVSSLASVLGDKLASEIGVFDEVVYDMLTLKRVKPGEDGGISLLGTTWALIGSSFMSFLAMLLLNLSFEEAILSTTLGFIGVLGDSVAGHFEKQGIGTKESSNLIGSGVAFLLSLIWVMR